MKHRILLLIIFNTTLIFSQSAWVSQFLDGSVSLNYLYFINENTGWGVGFNGSMVNTTNGGETWNILEFVTKEQLYSVYFLNPDTGFISSRGFLLKTFNAGLNWEVVNIDTLIENKKIDIKEMYFPNLDTAYFAGAIREVIGGDMDVVSWDEMYLMTSFNNLKSFEIVHPKKWRDSVITSFCKLHYPDRMSGGIFYKDYSDDLRRFFGFNFTFFVNYKIGYALEGPCKIVKTTTGGE